MRGELWTWNVPAVNILTMTHKSWTKDRQTACLMPTSWTDSWQDECRQLDENPNFIFRPGTRVSTQCLTLLQLLLLCYCLGCCFSGTFISYSKIVEIEVGAQLELWQKCSGPLRHGGNSTCELCSGRAGADDWWGVWNIRVSKRQMSFKCNFSVFFVQFE